MEEGEGEGLERIDVIDESDKSKKVIPIAPPLPGAAAIENNYEAASIDIVSSDVALEDIVCTKAASIVDES